MEAVGSVEAKDWLYSSPIVSSLDDSGTLQARYRQILAYFDQSQVDKASTTEMADTGSSPGRVNPTNINTGIYSFPTWRSAITNQCEPSSRSQQLQNQIPWHFVIFL